MTDIAKAHSLVKTAVLGVGITNASNEDILKYIVRQIKDHRSKIKIFTPNPEMIVYAHHHPDFYTLLNSADISLADGVGMTLAASFFHTPLTERIAGVDFMEYLCLESAKHGWTVGLLGAKPGVALRASECLKVKYPGLKVGFATHAVDGHILSHNSLFTHMPQTDILFVAYGFPKQEEWIAENLEKLPVIVAMSVGGSFDYLSGDVRRAPLLIRLIGFEWFFRLFRQPWRWKRQLALIEFVWLVLMKLLSPRRA